MPSALRKEGITGFVMVMERKIFNFSLHHHHKTCEKRFFSHEKIWDDSYLKNLVKRDLHSHEKFEMTHSSLFIQTQ